MLPVWCRLWGLFLSTPSARRATFCGGSGGSGWPISIHALREEGDAYEPFHLREKIEISIHALREEGDFDSVYVLLSRCIFLSTPSARRATPSWNAESCLSRIISIHALREEDDGQRVAGSCGAAQFLSTPSARRATAAMLEITLFSLISIHALREEGDSTSIAATTRLGDFYPRPPRGGRPQRTAGRKQRGDFYPRPPRGGRPVVVLQHVGFHQFLSTPSARRATLKTTITTNVGGISIHALREEGDRRAFLQGRLPVYFYPRPPRGGRHFTDPEDTCPG